MDCAIPALTTSRNRRGCHRAKMVVVEAPSEGEAVHGKFIQNWTMPVQRQLVGLWNNKLRIARLSIGERACLL
jgi:hypothetical protein